MLKKSVTRIVGHSTLHFTQKPSFHFEKSCKLHIPPPPKKKNSCILSVFGIRKKKTYFIHFVHFHPCTVAETGGFTLYNAPRSQANYPIMLTSFHQG